MVWGLYIYLTGIIGWHINFNVKIVNLPCAGNTIFATKIQKSILMTETSRLWTTLLVTGGRAVDVKVNLIKGLSVVIYQGCLEHIKKKIKNYNSPVMTSFIYTKKSPQIYLELFHTK